MKKIMSMLVFVVLVVGFVDVANSVTKQEFRQCTAVIHACFQSDFKDLFANPPTGFSECNARCELKPSNDFVCTFEECQNACFVVFLDEENTCLPRTPQ